MQLYGRRAFVIMTPDKKYVLKGKGSPLLISVEDDKDRHKPCTWVSRKQAMDFIKCFESHYGTTLVPFEASFSLNVL